MTQDDINLLNFVNGGNQTDNLNSTNQPASDTDLLNSINSQNQPTNQNQGFIRNTIGGISNFANNTLGKAVDFGLRDISGIKSPEQLQTLAPQESPGFLGSAFQNTFGSRGVAGFAQTPARIFEGTQLLGQAKDLDESRGNLAELTTGLIRALRGITDPNRRKIIQEQIDESLKEIQNLNNQARQLEGQVITPGQVIQSGVNTALLGAGAIQPESVLGSAIKFGGGFKNFITSVLQNAKTTAPIAGVIGAAGQIGQEKQLDADSIDRILSRGIASAPYGPLLSLITQGGGALINKFVPKLLSFTKDNGQNVLQDALSPQAIQQKIEQSQEPLAQLQRAYAARTAARQTLSTQYDEGIQGLKEIYPETSINIQPSIQKLISFPNFNDVLDNLPPGVQTEKGVGIEDAFKFYKAVNEASTNSLNNQELVDFSRVRTALRNSIINSLGGKGGAADEFLNNYSDKKLILDRFTNLIRFFNQDIPGSQQTAINALANAIQKNRPAFISSLKDFEDAFGQPVIDIAAKIAASSPSLQTTGDDLLDALIKKGLNAALSKISPKIGVIGKGLQFSGGIIKKTAGLAGKTIQAGQNIAENSGLSSPQGQTELRTTFLQAILGNQNNQE